MSVDRREFLTAGSLSAGGTLCPSPMPSRRGNPRQRSEIADFGVDPSGAGDQTAALQRAIDAITEAGIRRDSRRTLSHRPRSGSPHAARSRVVRAASSYAPVQANPCSRRRTMMRFACPASCSTARRRASPAAEAARSSPSSAAPCRSAIAAWNVARAVRSRPENAAGSLRGVEVDGCYGPAVQLAKARGFSVTACAVAKADVGRHPSRGRRWRAMAC